MRSPFGVERLAVAPLCVRQHHISRLPRRRELRRCGFSATKPARPRAPPGRSCPASRSRRRWRGARTSPPTAGGPRRRRGRRRSWRLHRSRAMRRDRRRAREDPRRRRRTPPLRPRESRGRIGRRRAPLNARRTRPRRRRSRRSAPRRAPRPRRRGRRPPTRRRGRPPARPRRCLRAPRALRAFSGLPGTASSARRAASASASAARRSASRRAASASASRRAASSASAARAASAPRRRALCLRLRGGGALRLQTRGLRLGGLALGFQARRLLRGGALDSRDAFGLDARRLDLRRGGAFRFKTCAPSRRPVRPPSAPPRRPRPAAASAFSDADFLSLASNPAVRAARFIDGLATGASGTFLEARALAFVLRRRAGPNKCRLQPGPHRIFGFIDRIPFFLEGGVGLLQEGRELFHVPGKFPPSPWPAPASDAVRLRARLPFFAVSRNGVSIRSEFGRVVVVQYQMDVGVVATRQMVFYLLQDESVPFAGFLQGIA